MTLNNSNLKILGLGAYLPEKRSLVSIAVKENNYSKEDAFRNGFFSLSEEDILYPADMAVEAIVEIEDRINVNELKLIIYNNIHYQGQPRLWSPASFVQRYLGANRSLAINMSQGCNSLFNSIYIAQKMSLVNGDEQYLCLASDRFNTSGFNRWTADYGLIYGDAATAVLLGQGNSGVAEILAMDVVSVSELEEMHRLDFPKVEGSFDKDDIRICKKAFMMKYGQESLLDATHYSLTYLWERIMNLSGVTGEDIDHLILPNLGKALLSENYLSVLPKPRKTLSLDWGLSVGHLGCSDAWMGLYQSLHKGLCKTGELALLVGAGSGFSWSLCLVKIL